VSRRTEARKGIRVNNRYEVTWHVFSSDPARPDQDTPRSVLGYVLVCAASATEAIENVTEKIPADAVMVTASLLQWL
jgi:hypothetical protein